MVQESTINVSNQVPSVGGTYDATDPQLGKNTIITGTARTLKVWEQAVHVTANVDMTLPPVNEAKGLTYVISGASTGKVKDQDDAYGWSDITMAATETWVFISNGISWASINANDTT